MSIPPESLVTVAHYLEDHDEGQRIKKLLFCLCKKYWENDPNVLNSHTTETLLAELVQVKPSIEQLTFSMYKLVKTLNRPKVYAAVAKTILDQLGPVYTSHSDAAFAMAEGAIDVPLTEQDTQLEVPQHNSSATPVQTSPPSLSLDTTQTADPQQLAERIAHTLSQHREQVRIQKLIFAVARGYWENSMAVIEQVGLANLILELRQRYPSSWELQSGFEQIVNNINKATLYLAIAQLILKQMEPLYDNADAMALADADHAALNIDTPDADEQNLDAYLLDDTAPDTFSVRYYPTSYQWAGWGIPNAVTVGDTEVALWLQDGDEGEPDEQPTGYTFFCSDDKVEHPAVDPDITKFR
ncbi:MAG: hypothetical protein ACO36E_02280, partial [Synechocystis sp.]